MGYPQPLGYTLLPSHSSVGQTCPSRSEPLQGAPARICSWKVLHPWVRNVCGSGYGPIARGVQTPLGPCRGPSPGTSLRPLSHLNVSKMALLCQQPSRLISYWREKEVGLGLVKDGLLVCGQGALHLGMIAAASSPSELKRC